MKRRLLACFCVLSMLSGMNTLQAQAQVPAGANDFGATAGAWLVQQQRNEMMQRMVETPEEPETENVIIIDEIPKQKLPPDYIQFGEDENKTLLEGF